MKLINIGGVQKKSMLKGINIVISEDIHYKFKNKVKYYDMNINELLTEFIYKFANTDELNKYFNLPNRDDE